MTANTKLKMLVESLFNKERHESTVHSIVGPYTTSAEAYPLLRRNLHNFFTYDGSTALLVQGKKDSPSEPKIFKLIVLESLTKYKCAVCPYKNCKECHYSEAFIDKYRILDDLMCLSKAFNSALTNGRTDIAMEIGDEIVSTLREVDLPYPEEIFSRFKGNVFLSYKLYYYNVIGKQPF